MGVMSRAIDVFRSHVNAIVDKFEDPKKMSNLVLQDMQRDIAHAEEELVNLVGQRNLIGGKIRKLEEKIAERDQQIRDIVLPSYKSDEEQAEHEALARELIADKHEKESDLAELRAEHEKLAEVVKELEPVLKDAVKKFHEMKRQRDILIARDSSAKAQRSLYDTVGGIGKTGQKHRSTMDRLNESVDTHAAEASAAKEIASSAQTEASLDNRVKSLGTRSVDDELARYRTEAGAHE